MRCLFGRLWVWRAECRRERYRLHRSRSHQAVIRVYDELGDVIATHEHKGGRVSSSQIIKNPSAQFCETLPFAFRSTEWDDVIVDVREKTTTIEVRILCTPRLDSLGNTVGSHGCLQHRWLSKNDGPLTNVGERPRH
jgi:hypothetical protein